MLNDLYVCVEIREPVLQLLGKMIEAFEQIAL